MTANSKYPNIKKAGLFVLGVIATLLLTEIWKKAFPESPVVIKEVSDSISVVHSHKFNDKDSVELGLERTLENLRLLNEYEEEVDRRIKKIEEKRATTESPNLLLIQRVCKNEGWVAEKSSSFFKLQCPSSDEEIFNFEPEFLNDDYLAQVKYFRLLIYRIGSEKKRYIHYDEQFEVKKNSNKIQLINELTPGIYEFNFGIVLKRDCDKKYPEFYRKSCRIEITGANKS